MITNLNDSENTFATLISLIVPKPSPESGVGAGAGADSCVVVVLIGGFTAYPINLLALIPSLLSSAKYEAEEAEITLKYDKCESRKGKRKFGYLSTCYLVIPSRFSKSPTRK